MSHQFITVHCHFLVWKCTRLSGAPQSNNVTYFASRYDSLMADAEPMLECCSRVLLENATAAAVCHWKPNTDGDKWQRRKPVTKYEWKRWWKNRGKCQSQSHLPASMETHNWSAENSQQPRCQRRTMSEIVALVDRASNGTDAARQYLILFSLFPRWCDELGRCRFARHSTVVLLTNLPCCGCYCCCKAICWVSQCDANI